MVRIDPRRSTRTPRAGQRGALFAIEIGEDYILGEATDELGVEYVQMWGLDRKG